MLNRRLVIGSLVAGAFLLPAVAGAAVTGVCSNCHTMHSSQNGLNATLSTGTLLKSGADCFSCHANPAVENGANGRGTDTIAAPQVDNNTSAVTGYINNAGFFDLNAAGNDNTHHNVVISSVTPALNHGDSNMLNAGAVMAPGGALFSLGNAASAALTCTDCHGGSGAHHGTTASSYRILGNTTFPSTVANTIATSAQTDFGAVQTTATLNVGSRAEVAYNATNANLFCASCHSLFHGNVNQATATAGTWARHPTDITMTTAGPSIVQTYNASNDIDEVPVGTQGADTNVVLCISCHVPHGSRTADLLAFPYNATTNAAGDATKSTGCETCHTYGANGM
jgi:hypothetical protein